jgi:hypothetical protein
MTRSTFETGDDLARQDRIASQLSRAWDTDYMRPSDPGAEWDYVAGREGVELAIEIKSRLNRSAFAFRDVFVNVHKAEALRRFGRGVVVIHFLDEIRWIDVDKLHQYPIERRGRSDRDGKDLCEAYRVPVADTRPIPDVWGGSDD